MNVLVAERHDRIVQLVNERGSIRVSELSDIFSVTEETIRRDLDALEGLGELRRSHGGAVRINEHLETPYFEREIANIAEKKEIALEALKYVAPGDQIILDASTTAFFMAAVMPNMPLKVLTNSLKAAMELSAKDKVSVIVTGGSLSARSLSLVGPSAEQLLDKYHVNRAFVSCKGVHALRGLSESNELQALVKKKMIETADEVILLADSSKFGVQDFTTTCGLERIGLIITNAAADASLVQPFEQAGVKVIRAGG